MNDRVALVTGGGRGIGAEVALEFARRGTRVAVLARTAAQVERVAADIEREGGRAMPIVADVGDLGAVRLAVAEVEAKLGPVDILVNNAAVISGITPVLEADPASVDQAFHVNVRGAWNCLHVVVPGMIDRGWGRVIAVGSSAGVRGIATLGLYSATKAAFERLHEALAAEVEGTEVLVSIVWPGGVDTDMQAELRGDGFAHATIARRVHEQGALRSASQVAAGIVDLGAEDGVAHGARVDLGDR